MDELDVVELKVSSGRWPAGTAGTVLELLDSAVLIEVSDERGHALDFLTLPLDAVQVVEAPTQEMLAL